MRTKRAAWAAGAVAMLLSGCAATSTESPGDKAGGDRPVVTLTLGTVDPQGRPDTPTVEYFVDRLEALTNGSVKVDVRWNAADEYVEGERGVAKHVQSGGLDLGLGRLAHLRHPWGDQPPRPAGTIPDHRQPPHPQGRAGSGRPQDALWAQLRRCDWSRPIPRAAPPPGGVPPAAGLHGRLQRRTDPNADVQHLGRTLPRPRHASSAPGRRLWGWETTTTPWTASMPRSGERPISAGPSSPATSRSSQG